MTDSGGRHVLSGTLVLADRLAPAGQIVIEDGRIADVVTEPGRYQTTQEYGDAYITPGLIDVHVHGIAGADVMDGSPASLVHMARQFLRHGVTGWLASTVTQSAAVTEAALDAIVTAMDAGSDDGAPILGIHLEGPFLNPSFKGMHDPALLRAPDVDLAASWIDRTGGRVVRWSLAPELPGAEVLMRYLASRGVLVSIAHTGATYEQAMQAIDLGARQVTHCFNAMTGLHHRHPGVAGAALLAGDVDAELIADGFHVHPAVMRLLLRMKGREHVILVTDSMSAADMHDGQYQFGGREVTVRGGVARLEDGQLASSTLTMDAGVRNLVHLCHVPVIDAVYMAATVPARTIGLGDRKGKLVVSHDADLAVFDRTLMPVATWAAGNLAWSGT